MLAGVHLSAETIPGPHEPAAPRGSCLRASAGVASGPRFVFAWLHDVSGIVWLPAPAEWLPGLLPLLRLSCQLKHKPNIDTLRAH